MKMRFEIPLSDLKPQALRGYGRRTEEVSQFCDILCAWASEHGPGRLQNPVLRRSYAPAVAAHTRPLPLPAICRRLPQCRHPLRARTGQAAGDRGCIMMNTLRGKLEVSIRIAEARLLIESHSEGSAKL